MTSCTFSDSIAFGQKLALERASASQAINHGLAADYLAASAAKVVPQVTDLYPGKFMLTFHHGRRYDQDDLKAIDCKAESDRNIDLAREQAKRLAHDIAYKGKSATGSAAGSADPGPGFKNHFPKPPTVQELDRRVASDQAGLWSLNHPTGEHTRVEKVIAKKWGVDSDKEFWTDGTPKDSFYTTFFQGRRYDSDDFAAQDKMVEGYLKRELIRKENKARTKFAGGLFPHEIAEREKARIQKQKKLFVINFPKREKTAGIGNGKLIKMLDALPEDQLVKTKWTTPEPGPFECEPSRPGRARFLHEQKHKIAHKQRLYKERTSELARRQFRDEEDVFGREEEEESVEEDIHMGRASVMSANTSVEMMKSEFSVGL